LSVCRSAQLSTFIKLLQLEPDSFETVSAFASKLQDTLSELKSLNLAINDDNLMGLILQMNLQDGPVKDEFVRKVESTMYTDPLHKTPQFDELLKVLYVCKRQISFSTSETPTSSIIPAPPSLHHMAVSLPTEELSAPQEPPSMIVAQAARTGNCHICQKPGYWWADCPHQKKPLPTRSQQPTTQKFNIPPHPYNQAPGYHPYCPIVVAPNFLPYGAPYSYSNNFPPSHLFHQPYSPHQQITQPKSSTPADRPYDSYKPNYAKKAKSSMPADRPYDSYKPNYAKKAPPVNACNIDVGSVEDEIAKLQIAGEATAEAISTKTEVHVGYGRLQSFNW
jgi:hypothetical protein